jgi:UDP-N-acetylglucosamine/UDP-N-acetylgalactosamine diphosphorylase
MIEKVVEKLFKVGQIDLIEPFMALTNEKKERFFKRLCEFDVEVIAEQKKALSADKKNLDLRPLMQSSSAYDPIQATPNADKAISEDRVACLILAGGQGTRLNFALPKALYPILEQKSLLQLFCEKIKASSDQFSRTLPVAIMTSYETHDAITSHLEEQSYFGLAKESISLFKQHSFPLIGEKGEWVFSDKGEILEGPDGNGNCLRELFRGEIWKTWRANVAYINVILIDNPLADPFDRFFLESHIVSEAEISVKAVENNGEPLGVFTETDQGVRIAEYSEIEEERRKAFPLANTSLFCFSVNAVKNLSLKLPWHIAKKKYDIKGKSTYLYKFETFIFDLLEEAKKVNVVLYPREKSFAPLKRESDLGAVRGALLGRY